MKKEKIKFTATASVIASLYIVLTLVSFSFGLSSGVIQLRLSEALCVLAAFTPAGIPGLFLGCLISNLITGETLLDIFFGSIATLLGALGSYYLRKNKWLSVLPPILANTIILPPILVFSYGAAEGFWFVFMSVAIGEILSCGVLGIILYKGIEKYGKKIF